MSAPLFLAGIGWGQNLPAADLKKLDLFLSNFAEAEVDGTAEQLRANSGRRIVAFVLQHAVYNSKGKLMESSSGDPIRAVPPAEVRRISQRYFASIPADFSRAIAAQATFDDRTVANLIRQGYVVGEGYEPETAGSIARVLHVTGSYPKDFRVIYAEYSAQPDPQNQEPRYGFSRTMEARLVRNSVFPDRFALVSTTPIPRAAAVRRAGTVPTRPPRAPK